MKKRWTVTLLVAISLVALSALSAWNYLAGRGEKWEYAKFTSTVSAKGVLLKFESGRASIWGGFKESADAQDGIKKFHRDLSGQTESSTTKPSGLSESDLLDAIGSKGWEMVLYDKVDNGSILSETWTFKRPAR